MLPALPHAAAWAVLAVALVLEVGGTASMRLSVVCAVWSGVGTMLTALVVICMRLVSKPARTHSLYPTRRDRAKRPPASHQSGYRGGGLT